MIAIITRVTVLLVLLLTPLALAQAPTDPAKVKPIPPPGKPLPAADRTELQASVEKLGQTLTTLRDELKSKPDLLALLPDIQVYYNAVRYPLVYDELIDPKQARKALADADARVAQLRAGKPEWVNQTGPRGYVSRIDGSVQPYVLAVPENYKGDDKAKKYRFDFWCHGRGEDLMELKFITPKPQLAYPDHFVVNLYGRYCNANKFAGEIDLLEALDDVKKRYPVDEDRLVDIGFSMGGAAAWQFAVHYTDLFAAASPGAGFSESRDFLHIPQSEVDAMKPWQKALWHLYDCTDYANNLNMLPTIAYAGELDGQKQASDMMLKAFTPETNKYYGNPLQRLIGPGTKHAYEKETRKELDRRLAEITAKGRDPIPVMIYFTTYTLRYPRMYWITVQGLEKHWERADVTADMTRPDSIIINTKNVTALELNVPPSNRLLPDNQPALHIGVSPLEGYTAKTGKDGSLHVLCQKIDGRWRQVESFGDGLRKRPGLQGPIDDAFMDAFLIVKPTGKPLNDKTAAWAAAEADHAIKHWQKQFRGEARVKNDTDVTDADLRDYNVICFGDPSSNTLLARLANKLPLTWTKDTLTLGPKSFDATHHMPALIYPNPLNPQRYVVLNSGFTFRESDYLNNARQTPRLPDYAIIDTNTPVTATAPGTIVEGGFFDERWQLPK